MTSTVIGVLDSVQATDIGQVTSTGWAIDTASPRSSAVVRTGGLSGPFVSTGFVADQSRPDVGAAFPGAGDRHGFSQTVLTYPGDIHTVCLIAGPQELGCRTVNILNADCAVTSIAVTDGVLTFDGYARNPYREGAVVPMIVWLQRQGGEVVSTESVSPTSLTFSYRSSAAPLTPGATYQVFLQPAVLRPLYNGYAPTSWCATSTFVA